MQIKTIHPMQVFCFETKTTLQDLLQYVRVVAQRLYKDAIKHDLEVTGPVYWIYEGADGQLDTIFTLTIALPVSKTEKITEGDFKLKTLDSFRCLSHTHEGAWENLGQTYGQLFSEIQVKELAISGQNREIYLNMDFDNPTGNITEVQIGLI